MNNENFKCIKCGYCCSSASLIISPDSDNGKAIIPLSPIPFGFVDKIDIIIYGGCKHFNPQNQECKIYENRPEICKKYQCWEYKQSRMVIDGIRYLEFIRHNALLLCKNPSDNMEFLKQLQEINNYFAHYLEMNMKEGIKKWDNFQQKYELIKTTENKYTLKLKNKH